MTGLSPRSLNVVVGCLSGLVVVAAVLVAINIYFFLGNRGLQAEVNQRQQFINESMRLGQLNNQLIQALVNLSAQTGDQQIRNMLAASGVTYVINQPAAAASQTEAPESSAEGTQDSAPQANQ